MAQKVKIILEDDFTGGPAEQTVRFGLDGQNYEMDLSTENVTALRKVIKPYVRKARKVHATSRTGTSDAPKSAKRNTDTPRIRQWAQEKGYEVAERGQIHQRVRDAYYAAQKTSATSSQ